MVFDILFKVQSPYELLMFVPVMVVTPHVTDVSEALQSEVINSLPRHTIHDFSWVELQACADLSESQREEMCL